MRNETRLKLDRAIRMRRLKLIGTGAAIIAAVVAGFALVDLDRHETTTKLAGTIEDVRAFAAKGTSDGLEVGVKLADGRHVKILAMKSRDPHVGDPIEVTEHRNLTGHTTFTLR